MSEAAHRSAPVNVAPGAVLAGRFQLDSLLGSGGMAEVWRASDLATGRVIAVKLLRPQVASSHEAVQRLKREGEVLSALSHPAIVRVETYGQLDGGIVFLAMELLDGETLGARMRRGRMEPLELAPIVSGTCAGLAAAHARAIVHRDLKPDNVFLTGGATITSEPQVKLLDFGISKVYGGDRLTYTGEILGTPRYMSPEQLGAEPDVDLRVDVYALGVILYEALAGKPPFLAASATELIVAILHGKIAPLRSLRPDLPASIEGVVMRAMARAREARYASATDLADAFLDAAGATAKARALPKPKVMRTQALGGAGSILPSMASMAGVTAPSGVGADADVLRPGTFSAFDAVDESAVRSATGVPLDATVLARPGVARGAAPAPPAAGPVYAAGALAAAPRRAPEGLGPAGPSGPARTRGDASGPVASAWPLDATPRGPASSTMIARVVLVAAGLLAGAVSMAIAIAALHFLRHPSPAPPPPAPPPPAAASAQPAPMRESAPSSGALPAGELPPEPAPVHGDPPRAEDAPADPVAPVEPGVLPSGVEPPADDPPAADRHADGRAPSRREPRAAERGGPSESGRRHGGEAEPAIAVEELDPMEQAGRALAAGAPQACIEILDRVIAAGATPFALKRRGDCLMRAGRREDAIRDYQRFCRIAPDHPAAGSVREQLAGMGLTCP